MLPVVAKVWSGRALVVGAAAGAALTMAALATTPERVEPARALSPAWTSACAARLEAARRDLGDWAPELASAAVRVSEAAPLASVELALPPHYSAKIVFDGSDQPPVFDWEETATPVEGSFALHRRVGQLDLMLVADDSDERGLRFASILQPLLDECVMEALRP